MKKDFTDPLKLATVFLSKFNAAVTSDEKKDVIERINRIFERARLREMDVRASGDFSRIRVMERNKESRTQLFNLAYRAENSLLSPTVVVFKPEVA